MNHFLGDLIARQLADPRFWEIHEPFTYRVGSPNGKAFVTVPKGFVTDFASVPRGLWNILPPATGTYSKAAVVHDLLYRRGWIEYEQTRRTITRADADGVFDEAMGVSDTPDWQRTLLYLGVRFGGRRAWDKHRKAELRVETVL